MQSLFAAMFFMVVWILPERENNIDRNYSTALSVKQDRGDQSTATAYRLPPSYMVGYSNSNDPSLVRVLFRTHTGRGKRWHNNQQKNEKKVHKIVLLPRLAHAHISQTVKQLTDILLYSTTESLTLITIVWQEREGQPLFDAIHALHDEEKGNFRELIVLLAPMHLWSAYVHTSDDAAFNMLLHQVEMEVLPSSSECYVLSPLCTCDGLGKWCFDAKLLNDRKDGLLEIIVSPQNVSLHSVHLSNSFMLSEMKRQPLYFKNANAYSLGNDNVIDVHSTMPDGKSIRQQLFHNKPHHSSPLQCRISLLQT